MKRDWAAIIADGMARGLRAKQIAQEQGLSISAVYYQASKLELRLGPCGRPPKLEWRVVLQQARDAGKIQAQVARENGVSAVCILKHCRRYGIELPKAEGWRGPQTARRAA